MLGWRRRFALALCVGSLCLSAGTRPFAQGQSEQAAQRRDARKAARDAQARSDHRMSGMGRAARMASSGRLAELLADRAIWRSGTEEKGIKPGKPGGQAETSIAIDTTGQHIVIGTNDTRGFTSNPISVSGFIYSDDGGVTFTDGGQLPITVPTSTIGSTIYPLVFGDPDVKYLGGSTFLYFSIMVKKIGGSGTAQTMGVHRSTDYGHTWQGPFEIGPATNPNGMLSGGHAVDAADKELADVDPDTGRVIMSWSNFTPGAPGGVEILSTYSDDAATATPPTWSPRVIVSNTSVDGQASIPRFAGQGSANAYIAWRRYPSGADQNVGFARSTDNGATFAPPINLAADFFTMDQVLGNDRNNTSPAMAVDTSLGPYRDDIYVVYSNNDNHDGADIVFQRSTDQGLTFSAPVLINSRPGFDRAQWFPWINVDPSSGRVYVFYYDQGIADDGDLTETTYQFSDDGGTTWTRPAPLSERPFHAGYGNDTGEPNLGDYNQAVAQNGELFAVWAGNEPLVGFDDGQPASGSMTMPDAIFKRVSAPFAPVSLRLGQVTFTDWGSGPLSNNGTIDPGEQIFLDIPLTNYVTNGAADTITAVNATLTSSTPGVTVLDGSAAYPDIAPATTAPGLATYAIAIDMSIAPATHIDLTLHVSSAQGSTSLPFMEASGTPLPSVLLSQDFDGVAPGSLPAGWSSVHAGGNNTVNWTTRSLSLGASPAAISNAAYHVNANDGQAGNHTRWERLFSPAFVVPAESDYVTVDFDIAYDTEDEPLFNIQAYDGALLRIADLTVDRVPRSVLVEAFAEVFTTGTGSFYPKHMPRSQNPDYLPDLSAWAGDSNGYQHVRLKLPGMAGSTAQLRFEYTQDEIFNCAAIRPGHVCGVLIDNIVVRSVQSVAPTSLMLMSGPNPAPVGDPVTFTATVTTGAGAFVSDGSVTFREGATVLAGPIAVVAGQAGFDTSTLANGPHLITADYVSASGLFASSSSMTVQHIGDTTTATLSSDALAFGKRLVGTSSGAQTVEMTNTGAVALLFSSFDGMAPSATFAAGPDFQGQTDCPLTAPGLAPGDSCDFSFVFAPSAPGYPYWSFSILANAFPSPLWIDLSGDAFVVDEPTVLQSLVAVGARLRSLQNPDGGWFFNADSTDCFAGPGVSCPNTLGVTGLGLPFVYSRTGDPSLLGVMTDAGDALMARYSVAMAQIPPSRPFNQDVEFLVALSAITGDPVYATTAESWFQVTMTYFPSAADRVDAALASRDSQGIRSGAAWDIASFIRAALAVGEASYALDAANRIVAREGDWKDVTPTAPLPGNPDSYDLTILGTGSLLWAFHDLPGFDTQIDEYRTFLVAAQDPDGSWGGGSSQVSAYVLVGLAAVGDADAAMMSAAAFFLANQLPDGGWPHSIDPGDPHENVEIDGEIARAMATLFNTPAGSSVLVSPAQLSTVTFSSVTAPGRTSVIGADLGSSVQVASGFDVISGLTYQVKTTALVSGEAEVCFGVPWVSDAAEFAQVRVLHEEGGVLVDRTILSGPSAPDVATRNVCALVPSMDGAAGFAIARQVADTAPPTASVTLTPSELWPPNNTLATITASIDVHDDIDTSPRVSLVSITRSGDGKAKGRDRDPDIAGAAFGTDDRSFQLRAAPSRDGIVYTVVYRATDQSGHTRDVTSYVRVPPNQGGRTR